MKDLKLKSMMYDNPSSASVEPDRYPSVYLPLSLVADLKLQPGDKVVLEFNAEVLSLRKPDGPYGQEEVCFSLKEGDVETPEQEAKETE